MGTKKMKDPCETCPTHMKKMCDKSMAICPSWELYIKSYPKDRNAHQMRITQYTETEE